MSSQIIFAGGTQEIKSRRLGQTIIMPKFSRISSVLVLRALKRAGFYECHQSGSHIQLRHRENAALRVTIPFHRKDLMPKTLKSIIIQAGLTIEEFIDLL